MSKLFFIRYPLYEVANGSTLDYCVAVFGIVFLVSIFQWFVDGRKNFTGPRMDVDIISGQVAPGEGGEEVVVPSNFHEK